MVLNTNNSSIAEHSQFIENTINNNDDCTWKIVAFHQSIYSVASHVNNGNIAELRTGLSPVFTENDIDVVLMGHDHVYARSYMMGGETGMEADIQKDENGEALTEFTNPDGVQYVTLNSASGSKFYNITQELFEYTAVQNQEKTPNYSCVSVDDDSFTLTTYRTSDQSVVDTFTINKVSDTVEDDEADVDQDVDQDEEQAPGQNDEQSNTQENVQEDVQADDETESTESAESTDTESVAETEAAAETNHESAPSTGDTGNLLVWLGLLAVAVEAGILTIYDHYKKKKKS